MGDALLDCIIWATCSGETVPCRAVCRAFLIGRVARTCICGDWKLATFEAGMYHPAVLLLSPVCNLMSTWDGQSHNPTTRQALLLPRILPIARKTSAGTCSRKVMTSCTDFFHVCFRLLDKLLVVCPNTDYCEEVLPRCELQAHIQYRSVCSRAPAWHSFPIRPFGLK